MPDDFAQAVVSGPVCASIEAPGRPRIISQEIIPGLIGFADAAAVLTAALISFFVRFEMLGNHFGWESHRQETYIVGSLLMAGLVVYVFRAGGLYDLDTIALGQNFWWRMVARIGAVALLLTALGFVFKIFGPVLTHLVIGHGGDLPAYCMGATRRFAALMRRAARVGALGRSVALVGAGDQAQRYIACSQAAEPWKRIIGVFDDRSEYASWR